MLVKKIPTCRLLSGARLRVRSGSGAARSLSMKLEGASEGRVGAAIIVKLKHMNLGFDSFWKNTVLFHLRYLDSDSDDGSDSGWWHV